MRSHSAASVLLSGITIAILIVGIVRGLRAKRPWLEIAVIVAALLTLFNFLLFRIP